MDVNNYISSFQIVGNSIVDISVKNNLVNINDSSEIERTLDVSYAIEKQPPTDSKKVSLVNLTVSLTLSHGELSTDIRYTVQGCFTIDNAAPDDEFEAMLDVNGCATLYSIARADIASISAHIYYSGKILLPMLNFLDMHKE